MKHRSRGWAYQRGKNRMWYIGHFVTVIKNGRKARKKVGKSTGCTKPMRKVGGKLRPPVEVEDMLRKVLDALDAGTWTDPTKPLTFDDLLELVKDDWRNNGRKSSLTTAKGNEQSGVKHLRREFGSYDARDITALHLAAYNNKRQDAGAAVSTVRNELNIVKRSLKLAREKGLLSTVPVFPTLTPTNVRTGFFERHELDQVLSELAEWARPVALFLYLTGWRRGETLSRQWRHVDFKAGVIRLEPGETKNREGRTFPFDALPELRDLLKAQRAYTDEVERRTGQVVAAVFHHDGKQVKSFRSTWRGACQRVGLIVQAERLGVTARELWKSKSREERRQFKLDRIPHDFRRTAVRNLVRAGVDELTAMRITGHKTRSVFDRYHIVNEQDLRDAVKKLAAAAPDRGVLPMKRKAVGS